MGAGLHAIPDAMAARSLLMLLSHKYEPVRTMALTLLSRFDDGSLPCLGDAGGVDAARVHSSLYYHGVGQPQHTRGRYHA